MKKRFSVIICAYNIEAYVSKAIESVLNQTFKDYELILVNDGSKDNTLNILKEYESKNGDRIKVIDNVINLGLSKSRNIAISQANGEYIVHLDGDDLFYEPDTLKKINNTIGEDGADVTYFGVKYVGEIIKYIYQMLKIQLKRQE